MGRVLLDDDRPPPPTRRLLFAQDAFAMVAPNIREALAESADRAAKLIGMSNDIQVSPQGLSGWFETFRVVQAAEIWANHGAWIDRERPEFGRGIRERLEWAAKLEPKSIAAARAAHTGIRRHIAALLHPGDVLCLPTSPRVAPLRDTPTDDIEVRFRHQAMSLLCISGLAGLPQVSLPLAELKGLPAWPLAHRHAGRRHAVVGPGAEAHGPYRVAHKICATSSAGEQDLAVSC